MTQDNAPGAAPPRHETPLIALLVEPAGGTAPLPEAPFSAIGVQLVRARGFEAASAKLRELKPQVLFTPVVLDGEPCGPFLSAVLARDPAPVVVVIAGNDEIDTAADAMRLGAVECLFRPFTQRRLARSIETALRAIPATAAKPPRSGGVSHPAGPEPASTPPRSAAAPVSDPAFRLAPPPEALLAESAQMRAVLAQAKTLAARDLPVFITGEVGSGKSLLAQQVHAWSPRADGPFITVDCAALRADMSAEALASAWQHAEAGTLYLDEICDLAPALQPLLVELISSRESGAPGQAAPRMLSSTRADPRAEMEAGRLRPELYYRLCVAPIAIPPLRERPDDIAPIANARLAQLAEAAGVAGAELGEDALARLKAYGWPGNLRELLNVITAAGVLQDGPTLRAEHLPQEIAGPTRGPEARPASLAGLIGRTLDEIEEIVVEETIRAAGGSVPAAAATLGIAPSTIYRKRLGWAKRHRRES